MKRPFGGFSAIRLLPTRVQTDTCRRSSRGPKGNGDTALMEKGMEQTGPVPVGDAAFLDQCRNWIEQKVMRAYVQLAVIPDDASGVRRVTLGRFGRLEVRLTETLCEGPANLPRFWL